MTTSFDVLETGRACLQTLIAGDVGVKLLREKRLREGEAAPTKLTETAHHESSHVIAGVLCGRFPRRAWINAEGHGGGVDFGEIDPEMEESANGPDWEKIEGIAAVLDDAGTPIDVDALKIHVEKKLLRNWVSVWALARLLLENQEIDGEKLRTILRITMPELVWPEPD